MRLIRELALSVLMALGMFLVIDTITLRSRVNGPSMEPTLWGGQMLLVSRLGVSGMTRAAFASVHPDRPVDAEGWVPPRGAIVTFYHPFDPATLLVKRIVGLPGEEISIDRGTVYVNGRRLDEPYVVRPDRLSLAPEAIPEDALFVMGDNRSESGDSRMFGPVSRAQLAGVAILRYFPFTEIRWLLSDP